MTKFEQVGINYQYDAVNKTMANRAFKRSCDACCHRGMHLDCDTCSIAQVHNAVIAIFEDMEKREICDAHEKNNAS